MRYLVLLFWFITSPVWAAYPYDAVGRIVAGNAGGSGTMFATDGGKGLIVTNAHVVSRVSEGTIYWPAVDAQRKWVTVYVDYPTDIAILMVDLPPVRAIKHRRMEGNFVVATGYPYYDRSHLHWQASIAETKIEHLILMRNRPVPGMSGGGAFDCGGYLIGLVEAYTPEDGILVSTETLRRVLDRYCENKDLWVKDASHVKVPEPSDWKNGALDNEIRSIRYDEKSAPELPAAIK